MLRMDSSIPEAARVALDVAMRDRLDALESLTAEQRFAALACLASYDGTAFDLILAEVAATGDDTDLDTWRDAEPYCLLCGADLGIFPRYGAGWQHFRGDPNSPGPFEVYPADHAPFVTWRPSGDRG